MRRFVLDRLNRWLTLIANVGVVAGIVFLGLEIQQNSDAIKAQIYQSRAEAVQELSTTIMDSDHFAPLIAKIGSELPPADLAAMAELSVEDRLRLAAYFQWQHLQFDNQLYQNEHGFFDEEYVNSMTKPAAARFTPFWEELGLLGGLSPSIREAIAPYLTEAEN